MRALTPLVIKETYYSDIEAEIRDIFDDLIYRPLLAVVGVRLRDINRIEIKNSMSALLSAIAAGDIWYEDGQFRGRFNGRTSAAILKLGGKFNVKSRTYSLPRGKLPDDLKFAQNKANSQYEQMRVKLLSILDNIDVNQAYLSASIKLEYEKTLQRMDTDFRKTLPKEAPERADNPASAVSRLIIEAKLTPEQRRIIADDWGNNLELYIKGWAQDNILKLRQEIQPHVMAGGRAKGLVKTLQDNYGVSTRKAKFLARQETALLMAKFQETRYRDIGIEKYRWSSAHDKRVRHDHNELDGKVFRFDSPPVSNRKTGARNNPGEDFECRCVAVPVFD